MKKEMSLDCTATVLKLQSKNFIHFYALNKNKI